LKGRTPRRSRRPPRLSGRWQKVAATLPGPARPAEQRVGQVAPRQVDKTRARLRAGRGGRGLRVVN
jgi:hypothetical protein